MSPCAPVLPRIPASCSLGLGTGTNPGPLAAGGRSQGRRPQSGPRGWEAQTASSTAQALWGGQRAGLGQQHLLGPRPVCRGGPGLEGGFAGFLWAPAHPLGHTSLLGFFVQNLLRPDAVLLLPWATFPHPQPISLPPQPHAGSYFHLSAPQSSHSQF